MGYSRAYPQNIAPKGTNIQQGFENDDKELKRIYDILSSSNGTFTLAGSKRQSVLYGPTDAAGSPNFLTGGGLSVSIDGSAKPIILAFANGFSPSSGSVDVLDKIDAAASNAWTLPANSTRYLYVDKDITTGLLSYGYTTIPDQYLRAAPSTPILDQHYFNKNEMKMYRYNGSAWETKLRVFVGSATTGATTSNIYHYPYKSMQALPNDIRKLSAWSIGDVVKSELLPTWATLECVIAGVSTAADPVACSNVTAAGSYITDGTAKWIVNDIRDATPVGRPALDLVLRPGYVKLNGATVNRADYPRLLKFATDNNIFYDGLTISGTTTSGSTTISNISTSDIAKLVVGMMISGGGIPVGATISSISTASIVISVVATASGTITITYGNTVNFPGLFGKGDGTTTFILPDFRGVATRGYDNNKGFDADGPNRLPGSYQADAMQRLTGNLGGVVSVPGTNLPTGVFSGTGGAFFSTGINAQVSWINFDSAPVSRTSPENRMKNIALIPQAKF